VADWGIAQLQSADRGPKVHSFGKWVAANYAALLTVNAGQYATLHCRPLLFWFPCKQRFINVQTFFLTLQ